MWMKPSRPGRAHTLSDEEIRGLTTEDKWLAVLNADIKGELNRVSQTLTGRIKTLANRYAAPLPKLSANVTDLTIKVEAQLQKMGFTW